MSTITRMWLGFAALCAGIIHWALVASSPLPLAVLLAGAGDGLVPWLRGDDARAGTQAKPMDFMTGTTVAAPATLVIRAQH